MALILSLIVHLFIIGLLKSEMARPSDSTRSVEVELFSSSRGNRVSDITVSKSRMALVRRDRLAKIPSNEAKLKIESSALNSIDIKKDLDGDNSETSVIENATSADSNLVVLSREGSFDPGAQPSPNYPQEALEKGQQGTVLLHVRTGSRGEVVLLRIIESSKSDSLDNEALVTLRKWHFPRESEFSIPIVFQIQPDSKLE